MHGCDAIFAATWYRRQGQSTQAFLSFVCEEAVTSMDVHQEDDVSRGRGRWEGVGVFEV